MEHHHQLEHYRIGTVIGHGSFATVYSAIDTRNNENVAVKAISLARLNQKLIDGLSSEITVMKEIENVNVVRLLDIHRSQNYFYLIMEYCSGGDLAGYLKERKILCESMAIDLVRQLACALEVLRMKNIVHRDLKPHNLLLTTTRNDELIVKVADFGFARSIMPSDMAETLCGSPLYMAPEILRYEKYDAKADLWSVGAILYEMIYGVPPYRAQNHIQLQKLIDSSPSPTMAPHFSTTLSSGERVSYEVSPECVSLMKSLLRKNPLERISFEEFFTHPLLQSKNVADFRLPTVANLKEKSTMYTVPTRKVSSQEGSTANSNNSSYSKYAERSIVTIPFEQGGARSLTSLSSSTASLVPPFARLKVGTPPSRISVTPKSSFISSDGSSATQSIRSSSIVSLIKDDLNFKIEDSTMRELWVFAFVLLDMAEQQEVNAEKSTCSWQSQSELYNDLYKLAMTNLLDLIHSMRSAPESIDLEHLKYLHERLEFTMEKIDDTAKEAGLDVSTFIEGKISSLIVRYGQKIAREGGVQELLGNTEVAAGHYYKAKCIFKRLTSLLRDQNDSSAILLKYLQMITDRLLLFDQPNPKKEII